MALIVSDPNIPAPPPKMLIATVVDSSGSMLDLKDAALKGLNAFIREQKNVKDEMVFYLATFSGDTYNEKVLWNRMRDTKYLDSTFMNPVGGTPLYDAIMRCGRVTYGRWDTMGRELKVVMAILTDGEENGSMNNDLGDVQEFVADRIKDGWEFIFIAPSEESEIEAREMGFTNIVRYDVRKPEALTQAVQDISLTIEDMRKK